MISDAIGEAECNRCVREGIALLTICAALSDAFVVGYLYLDTVHPNKRLRSGPNAARRVYLYRGRCGVQAAPVQGLRVLSFEHILHLRINYVPSKLKALELMEKRSQKAIHLFGEGRVG